MTALGGRREPAMNPSSPRREAIRRIAQRGKYRAIQRELARRAAICRIREETRTRIEFDYRRGRLSIETTSSWGPWAVFLGTAAGAYLALKE